MKKIIAIALTLALLSLASVASASTITVSFTADNFVTDLTLTATGGTASTVDGFSSLANLNNWQNSDTVSLDLAQNTGYQLVWTIQNDGVTGSNNPFAFLAEITDSDNTVSRLSSASWEVSLDGISWYSATEYAFNSGLLADGSGTSIWGNASSAVSGISDDAMWIGLDEFPGAGESTMYVRTSFVTSETPIPAAAWLMGSGLVGLLGIRRFGRK